VTPTALTDCTATDLLALYRSRQASPVEATQAVLARIDRLNPKLLAYCHVAPGEALAAARASEARWQRGQPCGALDGVPTSIKDLILAKGWPTLRGSRTVDANQPWDVDAPATARLREAGAVLLGKTSTPEFGCKGETNSPRTGISRNPWDPSKTPGGSSGGTAAAVAAGLGPLSVGTDGAGSVRIPAAFCGNFGLKPSFGRVPAHPLSPFGTVAHLGPHTMSVRDAALMLTVLAQPDARDWTSLPYDPRDYAVGLDDGIRGLRIAWSPTLGYAKNVHPEVAAACAKAVDELRALGAHVEAVDPGIEDPLEITCGLWFVGAWTVWNTLTPEQQKLTDPDFAAEAELGTRYSALDVQRLGLRRGRPHAAVHAALRSAGHAERRGAGVRRQARRAHAARTVVDARLDAVLLSVQPDATARVLDPLRADIGRAADRAAVRRADVRRRAGAARRARLRIGATDPAAVAQGAAVSRRATGREANAGVTSTAATR
jgi:aspartyl-tRNA(Asn)/glutamyl-tRNA(Gln) amidotransferase subunit A